MSAFLKTLKFTRYNPVPNGQQNRKSSSQFPKKFPQKHLRIFPAPWLFLTGYGTSLIEIFHMSSRRPYWCPKTITRRPFWCFKQVLGTNLKPPVLCASAQGNKIKPIFRLIYKTLPYLQTQCQSISDWNFTEFRDTHKAAENFNPREETSRSLQWSCYSWTKIFETSVELICDQVLVFAMSINLRLKFHRIPRYSQSGWKF